MGSSWRPDPEPGMGADPHSGTLLSLNVAQPATAMFRGRAVRTAIDKMSVRGPRRVRRLNVDGDGQADLVGHGGEHRALLVYQRQSYDYWERELGRPITRPGTFGENLTVDGLGDDEVCIGDHLAVGTALLQVTQPRVTCFKVGVALHQPRMPALLTGHHRPGFYLRVLTEGDVEAGDCIEIVARDPAALSVARISDLLYTSDRDMPSLRAALEGPALPEGWTRSLERLLDDLMAGRPSASNPGLAPSAQNRPAWAGFRRFVLTATTRQTPTVASVHLAPADGSASPPFLPGQHVSVRLAGPPPDEAGAREPVIRSYSLSGPPDASTLRLTVRRAGLGSQLLGALQQGDELEVSAPRGHVVLDLADQRPLLLISAGVGITPLLAMLAAQAAHHPSRPVTWVHVARTSAEQVFAAEAEELLTRMPAARGLVLYTAPAPEAPRDETIRRHLTVEHLRDLRARPGTVAYVCGPPGFTQGVTADLTELGLSVEDIHTESFGPRVGSSSDAAPHPPAAAPTGGDAVTFARSGFSVPFDPERWSSLLDLADDCDIPIPWSCRSGVCHRCETTLLDGDIDYRPDPIEPPGAGLVLACCAIPRTPVHLDL